MTMELEGKIAVVTGGGRSLGRTLALTLAAEGARVVIVDINEADARQVTAEIEKNGGRALTAIADIRKKDQVEAVVASACRELGRVDILVNNAATMGKQGPWCELSEDELDLAMGVNFKGALLCCQAVASRMIGQKSGKIVNIASPAGLKGEPYNGIYAASKAALISMTQSLALELAQYSINVNAVCPGAMLESAVMRVLHERSKYFGLTPEEYERRAKASFPLPEPLKFTDVANAVVFLASAKAAKISGQALSITGGRTIN